MTKLYSVFITCLLPVIPRGFKGTCFAFVVCFDARVRFLFFRAWKVFFVLLYFFLFFSYLFDLCVVFGLAAEVGGSWRLQCHW